MRVFVLLTFLAVHTTGVFAAPSTYYWVDWFNGATTSPSGYTTTGTITTPTTTVDVDFQSSANIAGIQYGAGGDIDYYGTSSFVGSIPGTASPYISTEVANRPPTPDIIRLGEITTVTITFSTPIVNPVLAIISTNLNTYVFDSDFEILSLSGQPGVNNGYWGNGRWEKVHDTVNNKYKLVTDMGSSAGTEPHGTIMLIGSFETIQWTTLTTEFWHGFTLGIKSTRAEANIQGDPQFVGLQGQSYQVHGADDTVFALLSTPRMQMNGLFTYIGVGGECNYNDTMCWSHPGTYISQLGFRVAHHDGRQDKILLVSGPHSQGLRMEVNGHAVSTDQPFFLGSSVRIHMKYASTVHVHIHDLFIVEVTNSDNFFNMAVQLLRRDWLAAGAKRVKLTDKSPANALSVYPQVELHGLLGITWRNVVYPHNRVYEGDVMDYAMESHDMFDTNFVYTQFL